MSEASENSNFNPFKEQFKELGIEAKYKALLEEKEEIIVDKDADLMQRDISIKE